MGIALIIPNISFAENNLGKVTIIAEDGTLSEITLLPLKGVEFTGETVSDWLQVMYNLGTPENQKGVTYSLSSTANATIDELTGKLTIKESANNSKVTVFVISTKQPSIRALVEVTLTYKALGVLDLTSGIMVVNGKELLNCWESGGSIYFEGNLKVPSAWGNNNYGVAPIFLSNSLKVNKGTYWNSNANVILATRSSRTLGYEYNIGNGNTTFFNNSLIFSPSAGLIVDGVTVLSEPNVENMYSVENGVRRIRFNRMGNANNNDYTYEELLANIKSFDGTDRPKWPTKADGFEFNLKKFILFQNTDYSTPEDFINNRDQATIDLRFDEDGNPYNGGTDKGFVFVYANIND